MERTITIEDTLNERAQSAIDEVRDYLLEYLADNTNTEELPCISNDLDYSGRVHEIIDGSVPIYTSEINDTMYLHGNEVEEVFDDAGIGDRDAGWPMGWKAAAIYCYLERQVHEWYSDHAEEVFKEWRDAQ